MDHSHHAAMDHGHPPMGDMCSMNMLFTWDTTNLCIVFRQWHVRSNASLLLSLIAIVLIGVGYEGLRAASRGYEVALQKRVDALPRQHRESVLRRGHLVKAVLYGVQNFYAFMLMLLFMTYNGWVMMAVSLGAFFGYLVFGSEIPATKESACH